MFRILSVIGFLLCPWLLLRAQQDPDPRWSIHFQTTVIGDHHWNFRSPYEGTNSLPSHPESLASLTATAFIAVRVAKGTEIVVNPEVAGGRGFGGVTGIAGFPNGEIPRVAAATPTLYLARAYLRQTWSLGGSSEAIAAGPNQTGGEQPARRVTWTVGKLAMSDFFDNNAYSHDPRGQFMNWALMENGAWDYPADTRGYTIGTIEELTWNRHAFRVASSMEPTVANGPHLDLRLHENRAETIEWETNYGPGNRHGTVRILGFANRSHAGTYREAVRLTSGTPDLAPTRRNGTLKYGFGVNLEQAITESMGAFARYGWNDGKTESWAFTEIDRTVSGGVSCAGKRWRRSKDHVAAAVLRNCLSGDHRSFLAAGGTGFLIGDGRLNYAPESIIEAYYAAYAGAGLTAILDYQHVWNPTYNRDRGPVPVLSLRLHWER